ncbi:hypothetical protein ACJ73_03671 [Blastomyces percursus]|uniref:DUF7924 domain-containing protein n=1 Tax=Blastomyces percursus TaxID=1658174 RepID=A0A1J9R8X5_9EURO|nr:hypothetical protein ACJ73_03671 [Blastomyces percursus]
MSLPLSASMQPSIINDPDTHDDHHMPCLVTPDLSCKRRQPEQGPYTSRHPLKRQKLSQPAPAYWDNLSRIWLTTGALRELDRRNTCLKPPQKHHKPVSRRSGLRPKKCCGLQLAPDPLRDCSPECLKQIKRFSRLGGPELSDLRNYPKPESILKRPMTRSKPSSRSRKRRAGSLSSKSRDTGHTTNTRSSTPYSRNFQQNLTDHGIYTPEYRYPNREKTLWPNNWDEIKERLGNLRPSLSPSRFSEKELEEFREADAYASKEKPVTTTVIPIIEGNISDHKCTGGGYLFGNLAHLTDGTLAQAKPDHFYGARPEQLNRQIRKELSDRIIPSTQDDLPMAPNFFLEAKGPDGSLAVATRQACYDGALGARGMHSLQSYQQDELTYDNNAYTITSTYHGGTLKLYTTHLSEPRGPGCRPEYIMTPLRSFSLTDTYDTFRQGLAAYRNARDWTKEMRDEFIAVANEHLSDAQSQRQTASLAVSQDSDASTMSDETEYQDAQWSFAAPIEGGEEEFQTESRNPKKQRVDSIVSGDRVSDKPTGCPN